MKKTFFIFALILSFTAEVKADACWNDPMGFSGFLLNLMKDPCMVKLGPDFMTKAVSDEYCGCIDKNKDGILGLIKANKKNNEPMLAKKRDKKTLERKKQLDLLYRYLNFEVGLQENRFQLTEEKKQVGCTPTAMAETFNKALCTPETCPTGTEAEAVSHDSDRSMASARFSADASTDSDKIQAHESEVKRNLDNGTSLVGTTDDVVNAEASLRRIVSNMSKGFTSAEKLQIKTIMGFKDKPYKEKLAQMYNVRQEANKRIKHDNKVNGENEPLIESPYEMFFANTFKEADKRISDKFQRDHKKAVKNACVNYDDFKIIDGIPTQSMMSDWSKMSAEEISKSFLASNLKTGNPEVLNYLRRNPVVAKNMFSDGQRFELAKTLKAFASQNSHLPATKVIANYAALMKDKIKILNENNQISTLVQCGLLAQNYAAAANPEMSLALESTDNGDSLTSLANNVKVCEVKKENKASGAKVLPSYEEIANANNLFAIFGNVADDNFFSPEGDKGYQDFIDKNCKDFDRFEKQYKDGFFTCLLKKEDKCIESIQAHSARQEKVLNAFYKEYPKVGELVAAVKANTVKTNVNDVATISNEKNQNKEVVAKFDKYVKETLGNRSMYDVSDVMASSNGSSGSGKSAIANAMAQAQESYSSSHTASQVADYSHGTNASAESASSSDQSVQSAATAVGSAVNPGQYIPPFLEAPKAAASSAHKISSVDEAKEALDDMEDAPKEEKAELASKAKEYLNSQDQTSKDIADLQKKLSDYEHKRDVVSEPAVADNTRVAARAPASVNFNVPTSVNKVAAGSNFGSASSSAPSISGSAKLSSSAPVSKAAASYASALNQANESRSDAKSLSLVVDNSAVFDFNNSPVSRTSGDLVIGASLEPSDKQFAEISSDPDAMKAYLAMNLKEVPVDKVVSIKCKGAGCNANSSEILLVITKGSDNKFSIRSVSRDTKVARSHKVQDLKNEINKAIR